MNERKGFLLVLLSFLGFVTYLMMAPYLSYIAGAAILAFMLRKPYHFLRVRAGPNLSAGLLVTLSVSSGRGENSITHSTRSDPSRIR